MASGGNKSNLKDKNNAAPGCHFLVPEMLNDQHTMKPQ